VTTQTLKVYGRYIVADPRVCHGKLTFRGTRIFVADVLDEVAQGLMWETISAHWSGKVSEEAIAEAVRLAREALLTYKDQLPVAEAPVEVAGSVDHAAAG
jgi:uncharacterized protein (DUF433 family)